MKKKLFYFTITFLVVAAGYVATTFGPSVYLTYKYGIGAFGYFEEPYIPGSTFDEAFYKQFGQRCMDSLGLDAELYKIIYDGEEFLSLDKYDNIGYDVRCDECGENNPRFLNITTIRDGDKVICVLHYLL
jgi:hypothetical protein